MRATLRQGARGDDVRAAQSLLVQFGYDPGAVDGVFGARTVAAVVAFQRDAGLRADGVMGSMTRNALEPAAAPAASEEAASSGQGDGASDQRAAFPESPDETVEDVVARAEFVGRPSVVTKPDEQGTTVTSTWSARHNANQPLHLSDEYELQGLDGLNFRDIGRTDVQTVPPFVEWRNSKTWEGLKDGRYDLIVFAPVPGFHVLPANDVRTFTIKKNAPVAIVFSQGPILTVNDNLPGFDIFWTARSIDGHALPAVRHNDIVTLDRSDEVVAHELVPVPFAPVAEFGEYEVTVPVKAELTPGTYRAVVVLDDGKGEHGEAFQVVVEPTGEPVVSSVQADEPTLRYGDRDDKPGHGWVSYLQNMLVGRGYDPGDVDGTFLGKTRSAVRAFQSKEKDINGEPLQVDGIVGFQTWAALQEETARAPSTDGRVPHTYVEEGPEARWAMEGEAHVYSDEQDVLTVFGVSTGNAPVGAEHAVGFFLNLSLPSGQMVQLTGAAGDLSMADEPGPGEVLRVEARGIVNLGGPGTYSFTAFMPPELGSDNVSGTFEVP